MTDESDPTLVRLRWLLTQAVASAGIKGTNIGTINLIAEKMREHMGEDGLVFQSHYDKAIKQMERR